MEKPENERKIEISSGKPGVLEIYIKIKIPENWDQIIKSITPTISQISELILKNGISDFAKDEPTKSNFPEEKNSREIPSKKNPVERKPPKSLTKDNKSNSESSKPPQLATTEKELKPKEQKTLRKFLIKQKELWLKEKKSNENSFWLWLGNLGYTKKDFTAFCGLNNQKATLAMTNEFLKKVFPGFSLNDICKGKNLQKIRNENNPISEKNFNKHPSDLLNRKEKDTVIRYIQVIGEDENTETVARLIKELKSQKIDRRRGESIVRIIDPQEKLDDVLKDSHFNSVSA